MKNIIISLAFFTCILAIFSSCSDDDDDVNPAGSLQSLDVPSLPGIEEGQASVLANGSDSLSFTSPITFRGFGEGPTRESWSLSITRPDTIITITLSVPGDGLTGAAIVNGTYNVSDGPIENENYLVVRLDIGDRSYSSGGNGSSGQATVTNLNLERRDLDLSFNTMNLFELENGFPKENGGRINLAGAAKLR